MGVSITIPYVTGATNVKAVVINSDGKYWNTSGTPAFETYDAGNIANYGIAAVEDGATGNFRFDFPAGVTTAGTYSVQGIDAVGASLVENDFTHRIAEGNIDWDGSAIRVLATDASGTLARVTLVDTTSVNTDTAAWYAGIISLAQWLGLMAGKQTADATALTEIKATGAGSGTFSETTDSQEAQAEGLAAIETPINTSIESRNITIRQ